MLDAGIQAMGGLDALRDIKDVWREGAGTNYAQGQSLAPDGPLVARAVDTRSFQDFAGNQNASLVSTSGAGIVPSKVATVAKDNGFSYNMVTKVLTPMAPAALSSSRTNMRRDPSVLLLLANERAETLRSLGEDEIAGRRYKLVTFSTARGRRSDSRSTRRRASRRGSRLSPTTPSWATRSRRPCSTTTARFRSAAGRRSWPTR